MSDYQLNLPPDFESLDKKQAGEYLTQYVRAIPKRVKQLEGIVRSERSFSAWKAIGTKEAMTKLGQWLKKHTRTRKLTRVEMEQQQALFQEPPWNQALESGSLNLDDWTLDERSLSLAMDTGIYFAKSLLEVNPEIPWKVEQNKSAVYYRRPILAISKGSQLSPTSIGEVLVMKLVERAPDNEIWDGFQHWREEAIVARKMINS